MNAEHVAEILAERALADDLAAKLDEWAETAPAMADLLHVPPLLARYREARQR